MTHDNDEGKFINGQWPISGAVAGCIDKGHLEAIDEEVKVEVVGCAAVGEQAAGPRKQTRISQVVSFRDEAAESPPSSEMTPK